MNRSIILRRKYWLAQNPQARIEAVEFLRKQHHGNLLRLQRVVRILKLEALDKE